MSPSDIARIAATSCNQSATTTSLLLWLTAAKRLKPLLGWCPGWDSNPHVPLGTAEFKSATTANSVTRAYRGVSGQVSGISQKRTRAHSTISRLIEVTCPTIDRRLSRSTTGLATLLLIPDT